MKRIHWLTLLSLLSLAPLLLLAACSGGGDGGESRNDDGKPREPTEQEVQEAEDAIAGEEQKVNGAVEQAIADLEARIQSIDPCRPDPAQLTALYQPLGILQQTGDLGDAYEGRVADALAPVARALARASANGQLEGSGISGTDITNWARGTNVDPLADDWMVDERCTEQWRIEAKWEGNLIAATALEALTVGHADFSVHQGGQIQASGPMTTTFEMEMPTDACQIDWAIVNEPLVVEGRWEFAPNAFVVDVEFGLWQSTGTMTCPGLGALPPVTNTGGQNTLPLTLKAEDGFTQEIGGEIVPDVLSRFTVTVVKLD